MGLPWSPENYARHAGARLPPAHDLLSRVPLDRADTIVDLGCGAGALFPALRARFPQARLVGVDTSPAMLASAAAASDVELIEADAATWRPPEPVDLIIANAALQWVPAHEHLVPALLRYCRVLAVQVPDNFTAPAYRLVREVMAREPWAGTLAGEPMGDQILDAEAYVELLRPVSAVVDIWQTTYYQLLDRPDAVLDWLRGTTLLPIRATLGAGSPATEEFEQALAGRLREAYPADDAGGTLFPFRRLFFVAIGT
jgi:trans-aconitate 2-methyltransferase